MTAVEDLADWHEQGAVSCAHWLSWRIGLDLATAREKVRVARALGKLPAIEATLSRGEISYAKVRDRSSSIWTKTSSPPPASGPPPSTTEPIGRRTRTIPPAIRRALWLRDRGCRHPGCNRTRFLQGHHIQHWLTDGPTRLDNLVLLCHTHHTLLHEGRCSIEIAEGDPTTLVFHAPSGQASGDTNPGDHRRRPDVPSELGRRGGNRDQPRHIAPLVGRRHARLRLGDLLAAAVDLGPRRPRLLTLHGAVP